jgi:GAF domain-containing protein
VIDAVTLATAVSSVARLLYNTHQADVVLREAAESVSRVLAVTGAGVCLAERNELRTTVATTPSTRQLERRQEELQQGPGRDCYDSGHVVAITDVGGCADRWPAYTDEARRLGLAAVASIPIGADRDRVGVLDLYDIRTRAWTAEDLHIARAFADIAAGYLSNAAQLTEQRHLNQHLERALRSRVRVEQAKGIVANHHGISPDQAFELIRRYARSHQITVTEISGRIIDSGVHPALQFDSRQ